VLAARVTQPAVSSEERIAARYAARHVQWVESSLPRVRRCAQRAHTVKEGTAAITVKVTTRDDGTRGAGFGGLQHCGSRWACPVCASVIANHDQQAVEAVLRGWIAAGGAVALATFTMSHNAGHRLKTLWDAQAASWHAVASGRGWKADQAAFGSLRAVETAKGPRVDFWIPTIRVTETTHGQVNGWHNHVHVLLLLPGDTTQADCEQLEERMWGRWDAALRARGLHSSREHGADVRLMSGDPARIAAGYVTKSSYEATRADLKSARAGHRKPFDVLHSVVVSGDADDLDLWHEWEAASKGRRGIAYTRGLRETYAPDVDDLTDEQVVELDQGGEVVCDVEPDTYRAIVRARADWHVLAAFRESDDAGRKALVPFMIQADKDDLLELREHRPRGGPIRGRHR
jgi:hypothetical protein